MINMIMTAEKWQRYIDNQCTDAERKEILHYLQSLSQEALERAISEGWVTQPSPMPEDVAFHMDSYINLLFSPGSIPKKRTIRRWQYWAAASVAAITIAIFTVWQPQRPDLSVTGIKKYDTIQNLGSSLKKLILPDNSEVWLTPHSTLHLAADYNTSTREVLLEGEAYFEVKHNPGKPFVATAHGAKTTVLGTHFNIESYGGEADTRVSLTSGKVAVQVVQGGKDSIFLLTPGNRLVYQQENKLAHTETFTGNPETDWKNGAVVLNDLSAAEVFHRLELRFGKKFRINTGLLKRKRFTATYPRPDLDVILQNMAFVQGFRYVIAADSVFIHSSR